MKPPRPASWPHARRLLAALCVVGGLAGCGAETPLRPGNEAAPRFLGAIPVFDPRSEFEDVWDLAMTDDGTVLLLDTGAATVRRYTPEGTPLPPWTIGPQPRDEFAGHFSRIRVGRDGLVYLVESFFYSTLALWRFTPAGEPRGQLALFANDSLHARGVNDFDVAVDGTIVLLEGFPDVEGGVISIAESGVLRFAPDGRLLSRWGRQGTDPGMLERPMAIAGLPDGSWWIGDTALDRIQRFSVDGSFVATASFTALAGLERLGATSAGDLYLSLDQGARLARIGPDGVERARITLRDAAGPVSLGSLFAMDAAGRIATLDRYDRSLRHFDAAGMQDYRIGGTRTPGADDFVDVSGLAGAGDGAWLFDNQLRRLLRLSSSGAVTTSFEFERESRPWPLRRTVRMAASPRGELYLYNPDDGRLHRFEASGRYAGELPVPPRAEDLFRSSMDMAVEGDETVVVLAAASKADYLVRFRAGESVTRLQPLADAASAGLYNAISCATDARGLTWILFEGQWIAPGGTGPSGISGRGVGAFDEEGRLVRAASLDSVDVGLNVGPQILRLDVTGDLLVGGTTGEPERGVILRLDAGGRLLSRWLADATGTAAFSEVYRLAVDGAGHCYVAPSRSAPVLRFADAGGRSAP